MAIEGTVSETFPAVALWDSDHDISASGAGSYPLLVPILRAQKAKAWSGSAYVTDHTVTVSSSTLTGSGTAWDYLLDILAEEQLADVAAGKSAYTNWRCINVAGTDYVITNVNRAAHTITVSGTPTSGSQTAIVYPYRIAGSTTTARIFKDSGRATMTPDGITYGGGMRRRDRLQGHYHDLYYYDDVTNLASTGATAVSRILGASASSVKATSLDKIRAPITDGTNGTPRTGPTTDPAASIVYRYMWAGTYTA